MQHHLVAAALGFLGDFARERQVRQHGYCEREAECENGVRSGAVVAQVVDDDGEARIISAGAAFAAAVRRRQMRAGGERGYDVNGVGADAAQSEVEADEAVRSGFVDGEIVMMRDGGESLREGGGLRGVGEREVDVVGGQASGEAVVRGLEFRANGDFGFAASDFLRGGDDFCGDGAEFRFGKGFFGAAREK